jgi:curved DNA-binding protein
MFAFIGGVQFKDYYAILGVPKTASQDDIRKAFRKLARQHHPDMAKEKDKKAAEMKFKEVNEANEVLGDPEKRKRYDELGADWNRHPGQKGPQNWEEMFGRGGGGGFEFGGAEEGSGGGFSDFFEAVFGRRGKKRRAERGDDVEFEIGVTVEEALHGGKKAFSLDRGGRAETITVNVPKGVRSGQKIRLAGQGGEGLGGGAAGDLYLRVNIAPHPEYRVEGSNLIRPFPLPVTTAVLGGEAEVTTPDGAVKLKIPAGTQPGQKFRLKGRGLPSAPGERGDFYAEAKVVLPTTLTAKERERWEELANGE